MLSKQGLSAKDDEITVNENGGQQTKTGYRFDLLHPGAMFELASVMREGAEKYPIGNWERINVNDHLNHAMGHMMAYLDGDATDSHLAHAFCRLMMALGVHLNEKGQK